MSEWQPEIGRSGPSANPVGILGGTFDPVHNGHLRIALEVLEALELAEVRFIPCRLPPHRGQPQATPAQRLKLLRLAVAGQPGFVVDERELRREGPSYMVDTLASLRAEVGNTPLCLLLGRDAFNDLPGWHCWRNILEFTHLIVLERPGAAPTPAGELNQLIERCRLDHPGALREKAAGGILIQPVTQLAISATRIRQLLAQGHSPRYLLPEAVWDAIREHGLYRLSVSSACKE
ncbi:MAG: nicotinate-nucleotide adenylyltransferase [Candidatus Competibacteraceae bacterium]